ncbi:hypothetical protein BO85DRAFT_473108 [Aspergillus piperis CBS 112811]|uniref:Uncharacterized protein n=1 Tax=Aspergillus piperis CBS 112811 TaxID=1448313 RepID=A0A8G1VIP2_9EURO|nr:hypothetical protein BO85DRAFT_473108 [Aspergillus piperis CBS 112811]RAH51923.1 hypothetical protein BO85DRAFT_473108 [Aspergillus piperis CBS 112811]
MSPPTSEASWPAGIPEIRQHTTDLSQEELREEAKGWLLFVREKIQPTSTPEDGLRQRRALIEQWATASQEFREAYHSCSAGYSSAFDYPASVLSQIAPRPNKRFLCLPSVDRQTHPRNYIHLVKFLILLYIHQDEWNGVHPFEEHGAGTAPNYHLPDLLGCGPTTRPITTYDEILPSLYLTPADFHALSMTRQGTVVFDNGPNLTWFVIDAPGLATGRLALVDFSSNGHVRVSTLRRPWNMGQTMALRANSGLDMDLPILDILESTRLNNKFLCSGYGSRDLWIRLINESAPGYLELEAQGREVEFELDKLLVIDL